MSRKRPDRNHATEPARSTPAPDTRDFPARTEFFAQILVEEGLLEPRDLRNLVRLQQDLPQGSRRPIGRLAVEQGFLDEGHLLALLDEHGRRLHLGELLVLRGLLPLSDLETAIREQKTGEILGETLLRLGLISEEALAQGLAEQGGIAYVPISSIAPDPSLVAWVSARFAQANGIVPLACRRRTLTVALWRPQSLALSCELEQATGLHIQVVLTTRREVEERMEILYGSGAKGGKAA